MNKTVSAVITAGGNGIRFGTDKMLVKIQEKPLLVHTLERFLKSKKIIEIIVLIQKEKINQYKKIVSLLTNKKIKIIPAKDQRIASVYEGIKAAKGEYIITHDGNRALTPVSLIDKLIDETIKYGAAMTAVSPTATIKYSEEGFIDKTFPRSKTWIAQTPQGFKKNIIEKVLKRVIDQKKFVSTDDSEFVTQNGNKVKIVPGDETNIKVTFPQDLLMAEQLLNSQSKKPISRVGIGLDSHRFEKNKKKPLIIGGATISEKGGLQANSDGDVILHSLCNALSSAIGGDSLGTWADEMCLKKNIKDSRAYLKYIFNKVKKQFYVIENISISVEMKRPRLSIVIINKIKKNIAGLLEIKINQLGMTFTSGEGLAAFGKGEGIQSLTIVNLKESR